MSIDLEEVLEMQLTPLRQLAWRITIDHFHSVPVVPPPSSGPILRKNDSLFTGLAVIMAVLGVGMSSYGVTKLREIQRNKCQN